MDADELEPGLNSEVGQGIGQQMPQPLSADKLPARRRDISPVHGRAGLHRADQGVAKLSSIPARRKTSPACPPCSSARPQSPRAIATSDRSHSTVAKSSGAPGFLPHAERILKGRITTIEVPAQDTRDPLPSAGVGVTKLPAANLRTASSASARICSAPRGTTRPAAGRPTPRGSITGRGRILVLPAVDRVGQSLGIGWPGRHRGDDRRHRRDHRVSLDLAPVLQPPEPPLDGRDPALPLGRHREFRHQARGRVGVPAAIEYSSASSGRPFARHQLAARRRRTG